MYFDKNNLVTAQEVINFIFSWQNNNIAIGEIIESIRQWKYGCE
ncbi:MAG: hypothetical protein QXK37_00160 [Candidatus Woesearchaeota archaeon]